MHRKMSGDLRAVADAGDAASAGGVDASPSSRSRSPSPTRLLINGATPPGSASHLDAAAGAAATSPLGGAAFSKARAPAAAAAAASSS